MRHFGSISQSDARIWHALNNPRHPLMSWMTNRDIAGKTKLAERTVQDFTRRYAAIGILNKVGECPAHYCRSERADPQVTRRLDEAVLLYVGISLSAVRRLAGHRSSSHWYDQISKVTIEKLSSREAAELAEKEAIKTEKPKYNSSR
jgi:hypothetical protein